jgi:transmembrane sensor
LAYGEVTDEDRAALDAWLMADRRHRGAYLRAQAGLHAMEDAVTCGPPAQASEDVVAEPTVKRALPGWAAIAACLVVVTILGAMLWPGRHEAPTVAQQIMNLRDGSVVTLVDGARVEYALSDRDRKITLLSGEATFKVAKDPNRPFVVRSGDVYAQATGTEYSVRRLGDTGGAVHVNEGSVLVWARDDREQAVLLHAGGDLTLDPGPGGVVPPLPPPAVAQISLDDVSIASAVARFNHVNRTQIVIEDEAIGEIKIVGLFSAHDPEQFAQAAANVAGARVLHRQGEIVLTK